MAASLALRDQGYTSKALASCSFFLIVAYWLDRPLLTSRHYWTWLAICYIPFLLVNSVLTALPVVQYNPAAIFRRTPVYDSHRRFFLQLRDVVLLPAVISQAQKNP